MAIFHLPCPHPRPRRCAMATVATVAAQSQAAVDADAVDREALPPGTVPWCGLRPTLENPMIQVFWTNKLHQREIYWNIYSELLKSTNLTELCQISLGRCWIRKSNKLTKSKVNPNGTPMYDKLCFGKFCCVKDEETPCGRNSQNIFKVVLDTTKNTHVILGRQWFTTCRLQVITRKAAFTCWIL